MGGHRFTEFRVNLLAGNDENGEAKIVGLQFSQELIVN